MISLFMFHYIFEFFVLFAFTFTIIKLYPFSFHIHIMICSVLCHKMHKTYNETPVSYVYQTYNFIDLGSGNAENLRAKI